MNKKVDITPLKAPHLRGVYATLVKSNVPPREVAILIHKIGALIEYTEECLVEMVEVCREREQAIPSVEPIVDDMQAMVSVLAKRIKNYENRIEYLTYHRRDNPQLAKECQAQGERDMEQMDYLIWLCKPMGEDVNLVPEKML